MRRDSTMPSGEVERGVAGLADAEDCLALLGTGVEPQVRLQPPQLAGSSSGARNGYVFRRRDAPPSTSTTGIGYAVGCPMSCPVNERDIMSLWSPAHPFGLSPTAAGRGPGGRARWLPAAARAAPRRGRDRGDHAHRGERRRAGTLLPCAMSAVSAVMRRPWISASDAPGGSADNGAGGGAATGGGGATGAAATGSGIGAGIATGGAAGGGVALPRAAGGGAGGGVTARAGGVTGGVRHGRGARPAAASRAPARAEALRAAGPPPRRASAAARSTRRRLRRPNRTAI